MKARWRNENMNVEILKICGEERETGRRAVFKKYMIVKWL